MPANVTNAFLNGYGEINLDTLMTDFGDCSISCATLDVPNSLVGPIASLFLQDQAIAEAIGWDGVGQPLAALFSDLSGMFN